MMIFATYKFQFTWFLGVLIVLAALAAVYARKSWRDNKGRSIIFWVVAGLLVLMAVSSIITYGHSSSGWSS